MTTPRTINCHDCGKPVSPSARECPQCGSKEFAGVLPPRSRIGWERRNDNFMIFVGIIAVTLSGSYGYQQGSNLVSSLLYMFVDGVVGLVIAMPIVFVITLIRGSRY